MESLSTGECYVCDGSCRSSMLPEANENHMFILLYNSVSKKIILVFRGSVSKQDYKVDFTVRMTAVPNPVTNQAKRIKIHTGFKGM